MTFFLTLANQLNTPARPKGARVEKTYQIQAWASASSLLTSSE